MKQKMTKKQREAAEYNKWLSSLGSYPKFARQEHAAPSKVLEYKLTSPPGRKLSTEKSLTTNGGSTAKAKDKQYTGTAMLGVGLMHKSNLVPVFREDDAKDLATMRRG